MRYLCHLLYKIFPMTDDKKIVTPQDPSENFEEMINDKSGLTGITTNTNQNLQTDHDIANTDTNSNFRNERNEEIGFASDNPNQNKNPPQTYETNDIYENDKGELQNKTLKEDKSPANVGSQDISGDMPDPSSDDDVLENAHNMGIGLDEDSGHPKPLDIGGDIDKAEEYKRTH